MTKTIQLATGATVLLAVMTVSVGTADAFHQEPNQPRMEPRMIGEHADRGERGHFKEFIESDDYEGFIEAIEDTPLADKVTKDMFETMVEIHELHEEGDHDAAHELMHELREEYDMPPPHRGHHFRHHQTEN